MARVSCQYSIRAAPKTTAMAAYTQMEPAISAASTTAISTAAVPIRTTMLERRASLSAAGFNAASATSIGGLLGPGTERTLPPLIRGNGLADARIGERRPERLRAL